MIDYPSEHVLSREVQQSSTMPHRIRTTCFINYVKRSTTQRGQRDEKNKKSTRREMRSQKQGDITYGIHQLIQLPRQKELRIECR